MARGSGRSPRCGIQEPRPGPRPGAHPPAARSHPESCGHPRGSLGGAGPGQGAADRPPAAPAARPLPHVRAPRRRRPPVTSAAAAARRQQFPGHRDPGAVPGKRRTARVGLGFAVVLHAARQSSEQPLQARMQEKGWGRGRGQGYD